MASGINSVDVYYSAFTCSNEECEKSNPDGYAMSDDSGRYDIVCEYCHGEQGSSSVEQDVRAQAENLHESSKRGKN